MKISKTKDIDKITVKDVTEKCGISRQTFYYHFRDIIDITEQSFAEIINEMLVLCEDTDTPEEVINTVVKYIYERRIYIKKMSRSSRRLQIEKIFIKAMRELITRLYTEKAPNRAVGIRDFDFMLDFYSTAVSEYIIINLNDKTDCSALANKICKILSGEYILLKKH